MVQVSSDDPPAAGRDGGRHGTRAGRGLSRLSDSYGLVFLLAVLTILATALLGEWRWGRLLMAVLLGATFLLAFVASRPHDRRRGAGVTVALVLVAVAVVAAAADAGAPGQLVDLAVAAVFVVGASVAIAAHVRAHTAITMRTVMAALCVYLFLGLLFAVLYTAIDLLDDGAYFVQTSTADGVDFVYFSFTTQSTVGYGDLTPATDLGRMLAITQALLGQAYLVTVVAALVSNLGRGRPAPTGHGRDRG